MGTSKEKEQMTTFEGTRESLLKYSCPDWFRDAKLGIYMHWGPYSVAERGEWYARRLYLEGEPDYEHHCKTYGHPSEFGYKDFVPKWKAENWDPDALVSLFANAGARYFCPCAVHHDNFDLWNSTHQRWNSVNMGPKKDIVGIWRETTLRHGLRFGVTTHLARSYSWMNVANQADTAGAKAGVPYDGGSEAGHGLYPQKNPDVSQRQPANAPKDWRDHWALRIKDLVDNYHPDHLYFDAAIPFIGDDHGRTGMDVISHFYNHNMEMHDGRQEGVMCVKERPHVGFWAEGLVTTDYERGKANDIKPEPWQTDDSIGPWGYVAGAPYMTTDAVIDKFIDIVSKNGNLLLNIPIKADGTLDDRATSVLEGMGEWLEINGEGIYGTRPWIVFGEGDTQIPHRALESPCTAKDIRYTVKGDNLYVFLLDWPGHDEPYDISYLAPTNYYVDRILKVELLGHAGALDWKQTARALSVTLPEKKPCECAYALKLTLRPEVMDRYRKIRSYA